MKLYVLAIGSLAAWLCGNLYEELVLVPNFAFGDVHSAMVGFRELFRSSNPALFYLPLGSLVIMTCVANMVVSRREPKRLVLAVSTTGCVLLAALLSAWIVLHVNLQLFFGPVMEDLVEARWLAREWLALNALRIVLVALAIHFVRRVAPSTTSTFTL